jgi:hypothetical protein
MWGCSKINFSVKIKYIKSKNKKIKQLLE